jgi:hypothetical protein
LARKSRSLYIAAKANRSYLLINKILENDVNKTMLALAMVATMGLTTAAFAETTPAMKHVQPAQSQAYVAHKKHVSHRVGAKRTVVAHHHKAHCHCSHYTSKKHIAKHVAVKKTTKTKATS